MSPFNVNILCATDCVNFCMFSDIVSLTGWPGRLVTPSWLCLRLLKMDV